MTRIWYVVLQAERLILNRAILVERQTTGSCCAEPSCKEQAPTHRRPAPGTATQVVQRDDSKARVDPYHGDGPMEAQN